MQQPTSVHPLKPARCTPTVGGARSRRDPAQAGGAERCAQGLALHGRGQWGQALSVFAGAVGDELASGLTGARRAACAARAACAPRSPRRPRACDARGGDARRYTVGRVLLEPRTAMADGVTVCVCVCVCVCVVVVRAAHAVPGHGSGKPGGGGRLHLWSRALAEHARAKGGLSR
jgi:hypothetical protein